MGWGEQACFCFKDVLLLLLLVCNFGIFGGLSKIGSQRGEDGDSKNVLISDKGNSPAVKLNEACRFPGEALVLQERVKSSSSKKTKTQVFHSKFTILKC